MLRVCIASLGTLLKFCSVNIRSCFFPGLKWTNVGWRICTINACSYRVGRGEGSTRGSESLKGTWQLRNACVQVHFPSPKIWVYLFGFPAPWVAFLLPLLAECSCSVLAGTLMQNGRGKVFVSLKNNRTKKPASWKVLVRAVLCMWNQPGLAVLGLSICFPGRLGEPAQSCRHEICWKWENQQSSSLSSSGLLVFINCAVVSKLCPKYSGERC